MNTNCRQTHGKVLRINSHQGNAKKNHSDAFFTSPQLEWLLYKNEITINAGEDIWEEGYPNPLFWGMRTSTTILGDFSEQRSENDLPCDPVIPFLRIYPYEMKSACEIVICTASFIAAQLTTAKI